MVIRKLLIFSIFIFSYELNYAQNSFYDDIHLMDYQRTKQILNDSNEIIKNSFLIRSTTSFQWLQNKLKWRIFR